MYAHLPNAVLGKAVGLVVLLDEGAQAAVLCDGGVREGVESDYVVEGWQRRLQGGDCHRAAVLDTLQPRQQLPPHCHYAELLVH